MFKKISTALRSTFGSNKTIENPEIIPEFGGLRLGGVVEIDPLMLKLREPDLTIENAATTQIILAVGVIELGDDTRLVRYYTDDEGYFQVLVEGPDDTGIKEISLWYFYDSTPIDTQTSWNNLLNEQIVTKEQELEGHLFQPHWDNEKPVLMTEKMINKFGVKSEADTFAMLYSRTIEGGVTEELLIAGEERINNNRPDRLRYRATGIQLKITDYKVVA
ncbi:YjfK family protein [Vibrio parahaemolyticus]|uniref:YjfK family protein n=2 Tax=Vibrionaceae TaxID=641 RepID=UPI001A8C520B|nr:MULTISPECIES: YjfK family protein [Vibrio]EGQ7973439.1 YjfK family protein [Vibrio parahaemolyticus]MBO0208659.1 YjfK family protein [Vibrio sp. Vb0877]MCR9808266.1 YjfK family protein [Vibrio parahaemolyticus]